MMPNIRKTVTEIRRNLNRDFRFLPSDTLPVAKQLAYYTFKKTKLTSHIVFIGRCLRKRLIPKGFRIKFHSTRADRFNKRLTEITSSCSRRLMQTTIHNLKVSQRDISVQLTHISSQLRDIASSADYQLIVQLVSEMNSRLYSNMKLLKDSKFHSLRNEFSSVRHSTSTHEHLPDKKIVVTIPADLALTEAETSVLSKGLTFVPVNSKIDEYQVKADCEKYFRRLRLKAHFHGHTDTLTDNTTPAEKDLFAKFDSKLSTWTPPEGQFSAVDYYIDRCRRFVNTLDFKRSLTCRFPNLSQAETLALRNLRRRTDVVIKPADKGGAVVVWTRPL